MKHGEHDYKKASYIETAQSYVKNAKSLNSRQSVYLFQTVSSCAADYARKSSLEEEEFNNLLSNVYDLILNILLATTEPDGSFENKERFLWKHHQNVNNDIKSKKIPYIDRELVEHSISQYLDLPFRSTDLDRILVDLLIAMEVYAFGNEMFNEVKEPLDTC